MYGWLLLRCRLLRKAWLTTDSLANKNNHSLEKRGCIKKGSSVRSEKNIELPSYRFTTKGVAYVMA
jgi:hypothetical protein